MKWHDVHTKDQLEERYKSILPRITKVANAMGYAVAVHGSMRRDLDIMAMPWVPKARKPETLVIMIQRELGIHEFSRNGVKAEWNRCEKKPHGRLAASFIIAFLADDFEGTNADRHQGHAYIDLSVMPPS